MTIKCACGRQARHTVSEGKVMCCTCFVNAGFAPADWHVECMDAHYAKKGAYSVHGGAGGSAGAGALWCHLCPKSGATLVTNWDTCPACSTSRWHASAPTDLLDFVASIASLATGVIRVEANKLLAKYGRPIVPLNK